jgi:hypothetical protein
MMCVRPAPVTLPSSSVLSSLPAGRVVLLTSFMTSLRGWCQCLFRGLATVARLGRQRSVARHSTAGLAGLDIPSGKSTGRWGPVNYHANRQRMRLSPPSTKPAMGR